VSAITDAGGPAGDNARRQTWTASSSNFGASTLAGNAAGIAVASAGNPYSATGWVRISRAQVMYPRLTFYSDTGYTATITTIDGGPIPFAGGTWTEMKIENQVAPATTGDVLDAQAATIVQAVSVPQPFHGSMTSDAFHSYAWTGTVDASTSTMDVSLLPPTGLTATPVSGTEIDLSWVAASGATAYDIERDGIIIAPGYSGTSYADTGRSAGSTYFYRVRSVG
jgi:hypothetical protein